MPSSTLPLTFLFLTCLGKRQIPSFGCQRYGVSRRGGVQACVLHELTRLMSAAETS